MNTRRLGRCSSHRWAMLGNMAASLFIEGSIVTTETRAKELRRVAEKLITKAKSGTLSDRRLVIARIPHKEAVIKLFDELGPKNAKDRRARRRLLSDGGNTAG